MPATMNDVPANAKKVSIETLQALLVDNIDLTNATRQAHWNVRGPSFIGLHKMFEKFYRELFEQSDEVAERIMQLGGVAKGTSQSIAGGSRLEAFPADLQEQTELLRVLAARYASHASHVREGIDATEEAGDADTADMLTALSRFLDKSLWMIEAHFQK